MPKLEAPPDAPAVWLLKHFLLLLRPVISASLMAVTFAEGAATAFAQGAAPRMEAVVQYYASHKQFMGTVLVARDGDILLDKGYGYADLEWGVPNTPTTKFQIASMTKQFTAASILLLDERGKLSVNDPIKKYMPDAPPAWDKITIYNLLTHTSGIPDAYTGYTLTKKPEEIVAVLRNAPLDFLPGETRKYSNSGYYILGYLIEKISGKSYGEFVEENILKPLGMNDSGYDSNYEVIPHRASGYHRGPHGPEKAHIYDITFRYSAGGLYSTSEDLLRWEQGLFGGKLLSAASLKKMTTPYKYDFACGLMTPVIDGHPAIEHNGGMDGFTSDMVYFPEDKVTVVVLNNLTGEAKSIASKLAAVALGENVVLPSERKEATVPPAVLSEYVGTYSDIFPGWFDLVVTMEDGHLAAQVVGRNGEKQGKYDLIAESDSIFFQKEFESEYRFVRDRTGKVTSVVWVDAGQETNANKR